MPSLTGVTSQKRNKHQLLHRIATINIYTNLQYNHTCWLEECKKQKFWSQPSSCCLDMHSTIYLFYTSMLFIHWSFITGKGLGLPRVFNPFEEIFDWNLPDMPDVMFSRTLTNYNFPFIFIFPIFFQIPGVNVIKTFSLWSD